VTPRTQVSVLCHPGTQQRREDMDMSGLIWTIFAVIGIIVVIGWFLGRV
jgi:hypothetical protein